MRHGCGYALANAGHDTRALQAWLGHKNIHHTVRYTEIAPDRFKDFWSMASFPSGKSATGLSAIGRLHCRYYYYYYWPIMKTVYMA